MTIGEFKKLVETLPDETEIILRNCPVEYSLKEEDIQYHASGDVLIIDI